MVGNDVYLVASGGNPNYGDELIVAGWLRFLAENRPHASVWLDCPQHGLASALYVNGVWPDRVGLVAGMAAARKLNGCRLIGSGLGLVPLPHNAGILAKTFADFAAVSARDEPSAAFLGLEKGLDDAFLELPHELHRAT